MRDESGNGLSAECQPSKLESRVRLPVPAPERFARACGIRRSRYERGFAVVRLHPRVPRGYGVAVARQVASLITGVRLPVLAPVRCTACRVARRRAATSVTSVRFRRRAPRRWAVSASGNTAGLHPAISGSTPLPSTSSRSSRSSAGENASLRSSRRWFESSRDDHAPCEGSTADLLNPQAGFESLTVPQD